MNLTPLGLRKPIGTDGADLRIFIGENMDILDSLLSNKESKIYKQPTAPTAPMINDLWINTTAAPFALSIYINSAWSVIAGGGSAFTEDATHRWTTDAEKTAWNAKADASTVTAALNNKVNIVAGKGLSTNDYTTSEKDKLFGLSNYANKSVLDALTDSAGALYYKGSPIASGGSVVLLPEYVVKDAWNTTGTRILPTGANYRFYINNTGNTDLTFTINSITLTVRPKEEFEDVFDPFTQVIITATSTFDANASGLKSGSSLPIYSVKDYFASSANIIRSFSGSVYGIVIANDGLSALTYTIGTITLTVEAGDVIERFFNALTQITINSNIAYRAYIKSGLNAVVTGSTVADTTPPINVTNLTPSSVTATTLTLSWTASASIDVASYDVYNGAALLGNTATNSFNVTGLTEKTQYTFTVKAKDIANNVASGTSYTTTTADITAPANVTVPTATNITQTALTLSWTASVSTDVASYDVYNGTTLLGNSTSTSYSITGLTAGTNYTFNIKAKDASNNAASGTTFSTITIPSDVTQLTTSNLTSTSLTVTWFTSTGALSYDVYNGATLLGNTTTNSYNVSSLAAGTQYTFKVIAKNTSGASAGVTTIATTSTTTVNPVMGLTAPTATINSITANWTASSSTIANQEVAYSTDGTNYSTPVTIASNATSYTFTGLTAGTTYTLRVVAIDASASRSAPATASKATATAVTYTASALPAAGTYKSTQNVALSCTPTGATIYYTVNGATPTTSSSVYSTTIPVNATQTIKYFAQDSVGNLTAVQTANYTIDTVAPTPVDTFMAGTPTSSTVPVSWTKVDISDVSKYEIAHSNDNFVNNTVVDSNVVNSSSTSYTVTGLVASTLYTIRVVAIDGAGNRSTSVTVQATTAAPAVIASDSFNRIDTLTITADSATTLGTLETGQTWTNQNPAWNYGIINNQMYQQRSNQGGVRNRTPVTIPVNFMNYAIEVTLPVFDTTGTGSDGWEALHIRFGTDQVWLVRRPTNYSFSKWSNGGAIAGIKNGYATPVAGDHLRLESYADGRMRFFVNGTLDMDILDTLGVAATTKVGLACETNVSRFDDFKVFELTQIASDTVAPGNVTPVGMNAGSTNIDLNWTNPADPDFKGCDIYEGNTLIGSYTTLSTGSVGGSFTITGLTPSTSHTYTIKAKDWFGNVSSGVNMTKSTTA